MFLILLEKDGKSEAYSVSNAEPTEDLLRKKLQSIADEKKCAVIARSHPIFGIKEIRVEPKGE